MQRCGSEVNGQCLHVGGTGTVWLRTKWAQCLHVGVQGQCAISQKIVRLDSLAGRILRSQGCGSRLPEVGMYVAEFLTTSDLPLLVFLSVSDVLRVAAESLSFVSLVPTLGHTFKADCHPP